MNKRFWFAGFAVVAASGIAVGYVAGRARAAGVPATGALTYSAVLTDTAGAPLSGMKNVQVALWETANGGTAPKCTVASTVTLMGGNFEIVLPDACATAAHQTPDLYVEVTVDGAILPRTKLGAVPYALEADTASNAAGALAQQLTDIGTKFQQTSCEDKGGVWNAAGKTCAPFMRATAQTYTGANRFAACGTEFPSSDASNWIYEPCSAFQAMSLSQLYQVPHTKYYWLWAGGNSTQASGAETLFRAPAGGQTNPNVACTTGTQSISFFHSWDSGTTDGLACVDATSTLNVLCCRARLTD